MLAMSTLNGYGGEIGVVMEMCAISISKQSLISHIFKDIFRCVPRMIKWPLFMVLSI